MVMGRVKVRFATKKTVETQRIWAYKKKKKTLE